MSSELDHEEALANTFAPASAPVPRIALGVVSRKGEIDMYNTTPDVIEIDNDGYILNSSQLEDDEYEDDGYEYEDELEFDGLEK